MAILSFPFGNHPGVLLALARKLAESAPDVAFSFFGTSRSNGSLSSWPALPNLDMHDVADGLPEGHVSGGSVEDEIGLFLRAAHGNFREAVEGAGEEVSCVLSDAFLWFAGHIAEEFRVPWVSLWPSGACSLSAHVNTDLIRRRVGTRPAGTVTASLFLRYCIQGYSLGLN